MSLVIKGTDLQDAHRNVFIYEVESYKILQMNETVPTHLFTFCQRQRNVTPITAISLIQGQLWHYCDEKGEGREFEKAKKMNETPIY